MRDKARIPYVLEVVAAAWEKYPDMRLGQLLLNTMRDPILYYAEDEDIVKKLREFYNV
jgi:uncharacterized protein YihD (DUF1040 family)